MRLVFAGTPEPAIPTLQALLAAGHEVVAVVTQPPAARGRSSQPQPSPVAAFADSHGLTVLTPNRIVDAVAAISELDVELGVVVAYGQLMPQSVLDLPKHGWVNLHFSLLPAWRGAAPVQRAIMAGDALTGASVFQLEAGMDTGPVFGQLTCEIGARDTAGDLLDRLAKEGAVLTAQVVSGIAAGALTSVPQRSSDVSYAPKLTPADARIDWFAPALAINRLVRGCNPAPGAWAECDSERFGVLACELIPEVTDLTPGQLRISKQEVLVGTGSHALRLLMVKPAGRAVMNAPDWARGLRSQPERLA